MRRHAKTSTAFNLEGSGIRAFFGRSLATRGACSGVDGSGAPSRPRTTLLALAIAALAAIALAPAASAAPKTIVGAIGEEGSGPGQFQPFQIGGIAVNQATDEIYVVDVGNQRVQRFDAAGEFVSEFGSSGTGAAEFSFSEVAPDIAVDQADGSVYVADPGNNRIQKFTASGAFVSTWGWGVETGTETFEVCTTTCQAGIAGFGDGQLSTPTGVAVDPGDGDVLVADRENGRIQRFDTTGAYQAQFGEGEVFGPYRVGVDSTGAVYAFEQYGRVVKFDSSGSFLEVFAESLLVNSPSHMTVDPISDRVFVLQYTEDFAGGQLHEFDTTGLLLETHLLPDGSQETAGIGIELSADLIYISGHSVFILGEGPIVPPTVALQPATEVGTDSATLHGTVDPNGGQAAARYRFEVSKNGVTWEQVGDGGNVGKGTDPVEVFESVSGLDPNTLYRVRLVAGKGFGSPDAISGELTFLTDAALPSATTLTTSVRGTTTATLFGRINPAGQVTSYRFEYGLTAAYGHKAPVPDALVGAGGADKLVSAAITGLQLDTTYHYRVVAENPEGVVFGQDETFSTRLAPTLPTRAYEMVTPPFKASRSVVSFGGAVGNNANPGVPSLDGETLAWTSAIFPLTDDIKSSADGDSRIFTRTASGWVWRSLNTLPGALKDGSAPHLSKQDGIGSSADFSTVAWHIENGELLVSPGIGQNILYTRRDGTGEMGFTSWFDDPSSQAVSPEDGSPLGRSAAGRDQVQINDAGTAMVRSGNYRGLAEDPATAGDDDPSDNQQQGGGETIYVQRADDPDDLPASPKDLVNECSGTVGDGTATLIPARIGSGAGTDTIGVRSCEQATSGAETTGTGDLSEGDTTVTSVVTNTGAFAVGQIVSGTSIPRGTRITAVGAGTLTLSAAPASAAIGLGTLTSGSPVISGLQTFVGSFRAPQAISGPGIPPGTTILDDSQSQISQSLTLSADATASGSFVFLRANAPGSGTALFADFQHVTDLRGARIGRFTAMSNDGRRIFFTSPDSPPFTCSPQTSDVTSCPPQLFVRQYDSNGDPTVRWISRAQGVDTQQIAELGPAIFQGASRDGRYVYFKTTSPLLPNDPNGGQSLTTGAASNDSWDLYRYTLPEDLDTDPVAGTLTRISGGPNGTADPATNTNAAGGPIDDDSTLRYLSDDGKRAYFVTTSPIAGADMTPARGVGTTPGGEVGNSTTRNLYLFDDTGASPTYTFIAQIPFGPNQINQPNTCASSASEYRAGQLWTTGGSIRSLMQNNCFHGTADGDSVIFFTTAQLTFDDNDDAGDIYLYDVGDDELIRISARPPGAAPYDCTKPFDASNTNCNADLGTNVLGRDFQGGGAAGNLDSAGGWGRGRYYNVAEDESGVVSVFFASRSQLVPEDTNGDHWDVYQWRQGKLSLVSPGNTNDDSFYSGNSGDGQDAFIFTSAPLDPREIDDFDFDIYDARIGGGFPYTPPPVPCDVLAHQCRGLASSAPAPTLPVTETFDDEGNVKQASAKPKKCGKGKVRRKGKCVKKRKGSSSRTANAKRGGGK